jgi:hypothetical protein
MTGSFRMACREWVLALLAVAGSCGAWFVPRAEAIPVFARQTGQNCLACHAGGQYPELTPYGRKFKLTGYTMGERTRVPLAAMAVVSLAKVKSQQGSSDAGADFPRDAQANLTTISVFCCGKLTDNAGLFAQWTHDVFDHQDNSGKWIGHSHVDQVDLRYADRHIDLQRDLIFGVSLNNNPGVTDVWNTFNAAFTPVPTYVPVANALASTVPFDVPAAPIDQALGANSAGLTTYAYWNDLLYVEVGAYQAADGIGSIFDQKVADPYTRLHGVSPYWRLALNHDWGAHSAMLGAHGLTATALSDPADKASPTARFRDVGIDGQYQYILDPHVFTAMFSYTRERQDYADALWNAANPDYREAFAHASNTLDYWRLKATYSWGAQLGAALAYTSVSGSADDIAYESSPASRPNSRLWIPEVFYLPVQNVRVGLQYYRWDKYQGTRNEYDAGAFPGRKPGANDSLFLYVWAAY